MQKEHKEGGWGWGKVKARSAPGTRMHAMTYMCPGTAMTLCDQMTSFMCAKNVSTWLTIEMVIASQGSKHVGCAYTFSRVRVLRGRGKGTFFLTMGLPLPITICPLCTSVTSSN